MTRSACRWALGALVLAWGAFTPFALSDDYSAAVSPATSAEELLRQAAHAGLEGNPALRGQLLRAAVAADPNYAPARWMNGEVEFEGKWRTIDAVSQRVAGDPRWESYNQLLASMTGAPADHLQLASWCLREGLENEERYHWARVLQADPTHELARTRLGVREYQGGLYTEKQIAANEQRLSDSDKNMKKFTPIFTEACQRASHGTRPSRDVALAELGQVDDPAAMEALQSVIEHQCRGADQEHALKLRHALIASLSNMEEHAATRKLLHYSVYAEDPEIRQAAAQSLRPRPVTDYVPQLMAALSMPIVAEINSFTKNGVTTYRERMYQESPLANYTVSRDATVAVYQIGGTRGPGGSAGPRTSARRIQVSQKYRAMEQAAKQRVARTNLEAGARNQRIRETLFNALDVDFGPDPRTYWQEWTSYNDLYVDERPTIPLVDTFEYYEIPTCSCFALGTQVWTQAGPKPIEQIAVGEMVLSQDSVTGELGYRPVLQRTVRPPTKMIRLVADGNPVEATLGHRFWINGKGWAMAKFLLADNSLHALHGPATLTAIEPLAEHELTEAYNLVVDEFHTYFVGQAKLLVHDNTCPEPTTAVIPGIISKGRSSERNFALDGKPVANMAPMAP